MSKLLCTEGHVVLDNGFNCETCEVVKEENKVCVCSHAKCFHSEKCAVDYCQCEVFVEAERE